MILAPVDPRPDKRRGAEQCPVCARWVKVRQVDNGLAEHPIGGVWRGPGKKPSCPGVGHVDTATYEVRVTGGELPVTITTVGRNQAEIIANPYRVNGAQVTIFRAYPPDNRRCTGLTARWCPVHGDCACSYLEPDAPAGAVFAGPMNDPSCPLHSIRSNHADHLEVT